MKSMAYSYVRFSSDAQSKSDSFRRQTEASKNYCIQNDLQLDETLNLYDLGISAFKSKNLETNLGEFIKAIDSGQVKKGSYLIVESLDRLSRDNVSTALKLLMSILEKDVNVVTLSDNHCYTKDSLSNMMEIMMSLLIFSRANEESKMKSQRISAAWEKKRKDAIETGKVISTNLPAWLEVKDNKYVIVQEKADVIKYIFELSLKGYGLHKIARTLNQENIPTFGKNKRKAAGWSCSTIQWLFRDEKVIGTYYPKGDKSDAILDYYPAVISKELYKQVKAAIQGRKGKSGQHGKYISPLTGLLKCKSCGYSIVRINNGQGTQEYWCDRFRRGMTTCKGKLKVNAVKNGIAQILMTLDPALLIQKEEQEYGAVQAQILELEDQRTKAQKMLDNLVNAMLEGTAKVLVQKVSQLEQEIEDIDANISNLKIQLDKVHLTAEIAKDLGLLLLRDNLSQDVLMETKTMMNRLIKRIDVDVKTGDIDLSF